MGTLVRSVVELYKGVLHTSPFCSEECREEFLKAFHPDYAKTNIWLDTMEVANPTTTNCKDCEQPLI